MNVEDASFLTRRELPAGFERWELVLPVRATAPTCAAEWAGALVRIEAGILEVGCEAGGHETFHSGDLIALGWLPIVELRNVGDEPVRLIAVRRSPPSADAYLQVARPDTEEGQ